MNAASSTRTLRKALVLAAVLALGACKKSGEALLVLHVTSSEDLGEITRFDVTVSTTQPVDAAPVKVDHLVYALDGGTVTLPVDLGVTFSESLGGIAVTVQAFGSDRSKPLASRTAMGRTPGAGEKIVLPVELEGASHGDGGTSDGAADARDGAADGRDARDAIGDGASDVPKLPRYKDNGDGTITDTLTGLVWQQVVEASAGTTEGVFTYDLAIAYCPQLVLGGHGGWRLPSLIELETIVDDGKHNPSLDVVFGASPPSFYWSSTPLIGAPSLAWNVTFLTGVQNTTDRSKLLNARCVSGTPLVPAGPYTTGGDGVLDARTKLTWQREAAPSTMSWPDANSHCEALGWRLPTRHELLTLVDYGRFNPSLDPSFPALTETVFWSSTPFVGAPSAAWNVSFFFGTSGYKSKSPADRYAVRCVR